MTGFAIGSETQSYQGFLGQNSEIFPLFFRGFTLDLLQFSH
jgi:hypothetical protein